MHSGGPLAAILLGAVLISGCREAKPPLPESSTAAFFQKMGGNFTQAFNVACAESVDGLNTANPLSPFGPANVAVVTEAYLNAGGIKYNVVPTKSETTPRNGVIQAPGVLVVKEVKVPATNPPLSMELGQIIASLDRDRQRLNPMVSQAEEKRLREEAEIYKRCLSQLETLHKSASSEKAGIEAKRDHLEAYTGMYLFTFAYRKDETRWSWVPLQWTFAGTHPDGRSINRQFGPALMQDALEAGAVPPANALATDENRKEQEQQRTKLGEDMQRDQTASAESVAELKRQMEALRMAETDQINSLGKKRAALAAALVKYVFPSGAVFQDKVLTLPSDWNTRLFPKEQPVYLAFWDSDKTNFSHAIGFEEGIFHGGAAHFWENKNLKVLTTYDKGDRHGTLRIGNEDGTGAYYQEYMRGDKHGIGCLFDAENKPQVLLHCDDGELVEVAKIEDYAISLIAPDSPEFGEINKRVEELEAELYKSEQSLRRELSGWYRDLVQDVRRARASVRSASVREQNLAIQNAARARATAQHRAMLNNALTSGSQRADLLNRAQGVTRGDDDPRIRVNSNGVVTPR